MYQWMFFFSCTQFRMATQSRNTQALMKRVYNQTAFFVFYLYITLLQIFAVYEVAGAFLSMKKS